MKHRTPEGQKAHDYFMAHRGKPMKELYSGFLEDYEKKEDKKTKSESKSK